MITYTIAATILGLLFASAIAADWYTIRWHTCREEGDIDGTVNYSTVLETITWLPFVFAIDTSIVPAWAAAIVCVLGSRLGTRRAMMRLKENENESGIKCDYVPRAWRVRR